MFFGCSSLQRIKLPENLEIIGERAFNDCTSLIELDFSEKLNTVEISSDYYKIGLVYNCYALERIIFRSQNLLDLTEINKSNQYGTHCEVYVCDDLVEEYKELYSTINFKPISTLI